MPHERKIKDNKSCLVKNAKYFKRGKKRQKRQSNKQQRQSEPNGIDKLSRKGRMKYARVNISPESGRTKWFRGRGSRPLISANKRNWERTSAPVKYSPTTRSCQRREYLQLHFDLLL